MIDEGTWLVVIRTTQALHHRFVTVKGAAHTTEKLDETILSKGDFKKGSYVIENMVKLSDKVEPEESKGI